MQAGLGEFLRIGGLGQGLHLRRLQDLDTGDQQSRRAFEFHAPHRQFQPTDLRLEADDLDFETVRRRLLAELFLDHVMYEFGKLGGHQVRKAAAQQRILLDADQGRKLLVREQDHLTVNDHALVTVVGEQREQFRICSRTLSELRAAGDQLVDVLRQVLQLRLVGLQVDSPGQRARPRQQGFELTADDCHARQFAALQQIEHEQHRRNDREQQA